jgi:hypothetical protein
MNSNLILVVVDSLNTVEMLNKKEIDKGFDCAPDSFPLNLMTLGKASTLMHI